MLLLKRKNFHPPKFFNLFTLSFFVDYFLAHSYATEITCWSSERIQLLQVSGASVCKMLARETLACSMVMRQKLLVKRMVAEGGYKRGYNKGPVDDLRWNGGTFFFKRMIFFSIQQGMSPLLLIRTSLCAGSCVIACMCICVHLCSKQASRASL